MLIIITTVAALTLAASVPAGAPVRPSAPAAPVQALAGDWAGDGFAVRSAPTGTIVQGRCAWGKIEGRIALNPDGSFRATGYFNPYSSDVKRLSDLGRHDQPTVFDGRINGKTLRLTLRIANKPARQLVLRRGAKIKFPKCT